MTTREKLDGLLAHFAELTKQAGGSQGEWLTLGPTDVEEAQRRFGFADIYEVRQHIVVLGESELVDYRVPITTEKLTVAVTNKGYLYLGSLDGEHNRATGVEQALLRLAYEESAKGVRRVPFDLVLALPRVKALSSCQ